MSQTQRRWPSLALLEVRPGCRKQIPFHGLQLDTQSLFLLIASQPPACSDVGTRPQSWEGSLFRGPRVTGQVTAGRLGASSLWDESCECYLPATNLERTGEGGG